MSLEKLQPKHIRDFQDAMLRRRPGRDGARRHRRARDRRARQDAVAQELANCAELYNTRVRVAAAISRIKLPRKGLVLLINGARSGVMEVLEMRPSNQLAGWTLGVKG